MSDNIYSRYGSVPGVGGGNSLQSAVFGPSNFNAQVQATPQSVIGAAANPLTTFLGFYDAFRNRRIALQNQRAFQEDFQRARAQQQSLRNNASHVNAYLRALRDIENVRIEAQRPGLTKEQRDRLLTQAYNRAAELKDQLLDRPDGAAAVSWVNRRRNESILKGQGGIRANVQPGARRAAVRSVAGDSGIDVVYGRPASAIPSVDIHDVGPVQSAPSTPAPTSAPAPAPAPASFPLNTAPEPPPTVNVGPTPAPAPGEAVDIHATPSAGLAQVQRDLDAAIAQSPNASVDIHDLANLVPGVHINPEDFTEGLESRLAARARNAPTMNDFRAAIDPLLRRDQPDPMASQIPDPVEALNQRFLNDPLSLEGREMRRLIRARNHFALPPDPTINTALQFRMTTAPYTTFNPYTGDPLSGVYGMDERGVVARMLDMLGIRVNRKP